MADSVDDKSIEDSDAAKAGRLFGEILSQRLKAGVESAINKIDEILADPEKVGSNERILKSIKLGWQKARDPDYQPPIVGDFSDFLALEARVRAARKAGEKRLALDRAFVLFNHTRPGSVSHRSATAIFAECAAECGEVRLCEALANLYLAQDQLLILTQGEDRLGNIADPPEEDAVRGVSIVEPAMIQAAAQLILQSKGDVFCLVLEQAVAHSRKCFPTAWLRAVDQLRAYYHLRRNPKAIARLTRLREDFKEPKDS